MREATRWGVDSAAPVTPTLYNCVMSKLGYPFFWGRYLKTISGVSTGMTKNEIAFLRSKGTKILPIYNNFEVATGYRNGKVDATNAIFYARSLGIPKDTYIFANIEQMFKVDEGWIRGWVDTFYTSGFRPGFYAGPSQGEFSQAYCAAAEKDSRVATQSVIWSHDPELKPTSSKKAPQFKPAKPPCAANVWAWQYGKSAEGCPVDTNLATNKILAHLY